MNPVPSPPGHKIGGMKDAKEKDAPRYYRTRDEFGNPVCSLCEGEWNLARGHYCRLGFRPSVEPK